MANQTINVPGVGPVNFPDTMSDAEIVDAINKMRAPASPGRGEFQVAEGRREVTNDARNIPAGLLTPDPATNRRMAEAAYDAGQREPVSKIKTLKASAGVLGGLLATVPGAAAAGISSGLIGGGTSGSEDLEGIAKDAGKSAAVGYGIARAVPVVAGKVADYAGKRLSAAAEKAGEVAVKNKEPEVKAAEGVYGGLRQTENKAIREAAAMEAAGTLSEENAKLLAQARASGRFNEALNEALANDLEFLTKRTPQVAAAKEKAQTLRAALPGEIESEKARLLSSETAASRVMDRVKRYWLPITGGAIGALTDGAFGTGVGLLAGRGASPTVQALWRMTKDPAVQTQMWTPVEKLARAMAGSPAAVAGPMSPAAPAVADPVLEALMRALGRPGGPVPVAATEEPPR